MQDPAQKPASSGSGGGSKEPAPVINGGRELETQLTNFVAAAMLAGNENIFKTWIPNSSKVEMLRLLGVRNALSVKVNLIIHNFEVSILRYLHALVSGFLLSSEETQYVPEGNEFVKYPTYTPRESGKCIDWLVDKAAEGFKQAYSNTYGTYMVDETYHAMWLFRTDVDRPDIAEWEGYKAEYKHLSPAWTAFSVSPQSYADEEKLRTMRRRKPKQGVEVEAEIRQLLSYRDAFLNDYPDTAKNEAIHAYSVDLSERQAAIPDQLVEARQEVITALDTCLHRFNQGRERGDNDAALNAVMEARKVCAISCKIIAWLKVKERFVPQIQGLYEAYKKPPMRKLAEFIGG